MKTSKFLISNTHLVFMLGVFLFVLIPFQAFASHKTVVSASVDSSSLTSTSSKPIISGMATSTEKIKITIQKEGSKKILYTKSTVKVKDGVWKIPVSKKLYDGTYEVKIYNPKSTSRTLATSTLIVNTKKTSKSTTVPKGATTFVVQSVPLLFGGTIHAGTSVPVSYLQVINIGKEPTTLKGFGVKQNGSASAQAIIGLTVVDDKGGSRGSIGGVEGSTPFVNGVAFAPVPDVVFAPGQMKLFTIKAVLTKNVSAYLGKQLMIDVTSVDTNASIQAKLPIRGTTWTIAN